jgi:hypothetical protein
MGAVAVWSQWQCVVSAEYSEGALVMTEGELYSSAEQCIVGL